MCDREDPPIPADEPSFLTPYEDFRVATYLAQSRGLPPVLRYEAVMPFLCEYGFKITDERNWASVAADQPQISFDVLGHTEFGGHTQYHVTCKLEQGHSWGTVRRLMHLREGIHDYVKGELKDRYETFFGSTPFARYAGVKGTTVRLKAWMASLAKCINCSALTPASVAIIVRTLDIPGTPLHPKAHLMPMTCAIFGGGMPLAKASALAFEYMSSLPATSGGQLSRSLDQRLSSGFDQHDAALVWATVVKPVQEKPQQDSDGASDAASEA